MISRDEFYEVVNRLARLIELSHTVQTHRLTKITNQLETLMAKIDDFIAAQQAHNQAIADDLTTIQGSVKTLNDQVATLTTELASAGLSDSQSAALDALTASAQALQDQADALAGKQAAAPTPPPADATSGAAAPSA